MNKLFYNSKNQVVGRLKDGIYRKEVIRSKHLMKMFQGYGISLHIVLELEKLGCTEIRIRENDTGLILHTPFKTFLDNKVEKNFDGLQCFLSGKYWRSDNTKQESLLELK